MTLFLLFLMGYQLWGGEAAHEWAGAGIFLLFFLHQGLHWNIIIGMMARMRKKKPDEAHGRWTEHIWAGAAACAAAYGIYVFVKRDLFTYLFLRTEFVFLDYGESKLLFYVDYLAMMVLFVFVAHYGSGILQKHNSGKPGKLLT